MTNKNTAIVIGIIVTILILIGIGITILFMTGTIKFPIETVFRGANRVSCSKFGTDTWACSAIGLAGISLDEPTNIFTISEPSRGDEFRSLQFVTARDISSDLRTFLSSHTIQSTSWTACKIATYLPFDTENNWEQRIFVTPFNFAGTSFAWCLGDIQLNKILGDGFIVVEGKTFEQNGDFIENVETYGLCRGRTCSLLPVEDNSVFGNPDFRADSMIIKWREGGYTLDDACLGFGLGCQDIVVYRFQNNECDLVEISELERLSNDFNTLSECQEQIDPTIAVFRFENNQCNLVSILESTRTQNDHNTLTECQENIMPGDVLMTVYNFQNNGCTQKTILESERTALDFNTLEDCEENIVPQICTDGETKEFTCPEGFKIQSCICDNNEFICIDNPENQCPEPKKSIFEIILENLLVVIAFGILAVFIIIIVGLIIARKKR